MDTATATTAQTTPSLGGRPRLGAREVSAVLGGVAVVDRVTVAAMPGELLGVIGPNGSGKTTLLRLLTGLLRPSGGEVSFGSEPLESMTVRERARRIAYMPQSAAAHPFTAIETVLMGRYPHLGRFEIEGGTDRAIALAAMERTGTSEFTNRQLDTLSGGERQRVMVARTIAQQGDVLLLDEPTASLDLKHQLDTMDVVSHEVSERGVAAIVIMHDLSLAGRYCDRLLLLSEGRVVAFGAPREVLTPDNLRSSFGVETIVEPDAVTGRPNVSLLSASGPRDIALAGTGVTVHVICGAGSGRDVMHPLRAAGYSVTACVLGEGDSDRESADRLAVKYVPSPPFSPISNEDDRTHRALVRAADFVVLCDMAVGPNNLPNLRAADEARSLLIIEGRDAGELDYTGGEATRVMKRLRQTGEMVSRSDLVRTLARRSRSGADIT